MPFEPQSAADLATVEAEARKRGFINGEGKPRAAAGPPKVLSIEEVLAVKASRATMLIESVISTPGLTMMNAPGKTGKTLLAAQLGMSVAAGVPLFEFYQTLRPGPVLFVEKDDPAGAASVREILERTQIPIHGKPFLTVDTADAQGLTLGPEFILWLDDEIQKRGFVLVVLDSYTALRAARIGGGDFVKGEAADLNVLDQLAKKRSTAIVLVHHYSKGSVNHDWSERSAGSYAMLATPEGQITMTRFYDLPINARERLVRIRGRRFEDTEMVLRLNPETLGFEHVLEGGAAPFFPDIQHLQETFGQNAFGPKALTHETGMARATAHRLLKRLSVAGVLRKAGYGEYVLVATV